MQIALFFGNIYHTGDFFSLCYFLPRVARPPSMVLWFCFCFCFPDFQLLFSHSSHLNSPDVLESFFIRIGSSSSMTARILNGGIHLLISLSITGKKFSSACFLMILFSTPTSTWPSFNWGTCLSESLHKEI